MAGGSQGTRGCQQQKQSSKQQPKSSKTTAKASAENVSSASNSYHVSLYRNDGSLRYSGQMVGHQKEGWGTEFGTGGKIIYVGNWRKGKRHGHGTHTEYSKENGKPCQRYVGNWKRGRRDGYGVQESYGKLAGGGDAWLTRVLDGSWKQDKFHGWGRMLEFEEIDELLGLASGIESNLCYEGTWLDNLRDGVGIAIYPNGDRFEGIWRRGQRNGRGRYWFANSSDQPDSAEGAASLAGAGSASCLQGVWVDDIFNAGTLTSTPIIQEEEYESNRLKEITNSGLSESGVPEEPATAPQIFEDQLTLPQP